MCSGLRTSLRMARWLAAVIGVAALWTASSAADALAQAGPIEQERHSPLLDQTALQRLFPGVAGGSAERHGSEDPSVWTVKSGGRTVGYVASTYQTTKSVGYSGQPLDILLGITADARISGALLLRHNEPVLTLGISSEDIQKYLDGFAGYDLKASRIEAFKDGSGVPDIIARATVTTGVIRDAVLRTARLTATRTGLIKTGGRSADRLRYEPMTWAQLTASGAVREKLVTFSEAKHLFGEIATPIPDGEDTFIDLRVALLDSPSVGQNILGRKVFERVFAGVATGDSAILVASSGLHSHRGAAYLTSGTFDRIEVIQGEKTFKFNKDDYLRIDELALKDAPALNEMSVYRLSSEAGFEAAAPFRVEVLAQRPKPDGMAATLRIALPYELPQAFLAAPVAVISEAPLWTAAWERKPIVIGATLVMILLVAAALFAQEWFVRRPSLWIGARLAFLTLTLVFLGWWANGQLSVVQVLAFFHSLLNGFRWETFLIEPVIFVLWSFVALGLLFWGRGVYCGWLCPFGALQELLNEGAKRLGIKQIEVPFHVQERLWAIKYTLFMLILGLSFYSMDYALKLAEVEPFKTAISMRFQRAWPFVGFAVLLLAAGLFIERFYCRYLCPLGAALAIPAKMKLFDWLHRRPQCGRECRFCETQCTVGAIDTLGRINPNECVLCLRCQVILNDNAQCIVLKRRAGRGVDTPAAVALKNYKGEA